MIVILSSPVVDGDEDACVPRALAELKARGWSAIDVRRVGPVVAADRGSAPTYISTAVADAEESGFGFVVYEKPIKPS